MKYAIVNDSKVEAKPKLKGICPHCQSEMIAKCGKIKVWHWAHKGNPPCDPWWESETQWHRDWKDQFPKEWQEISHLDHRTGEKHIADIQTAHGLTLEFQHSAIKPEERESREDFYDNLIWVVDGKLNGIDRHFNMGFSRDPIMQKPLAYRFSIFGRSRFFHNWTLRDFDNSKVKVFFDFGTEILWRFVYFDESQKSGAVGPISKKDFIEDCINGIEIRKTYIED